MAVDSAPPCLPGRGGSASPFGGAGATISRRRHGPGLLALGLPDGRDDARIPQAEADHRSGLWSSCGAVTPRPPPRRRDPASTAVPAATLARYLPGQARPGSRRSGPRRRGRSCGARSAGPWALIRPVLSVSLIPIRPLGKGHGPVMAATLGVIAFGHAACIIRRRRDFRPSRRVSDGRNGTGHAPAGAATAPFAAKRERSGKGDSGRLPALMP